jgi:3-hydroxyacyl-CoA dehydrogenase/enoyl-CoA hydratase/3-hydroxybutyryl-CoA epimerase
MPAIFAELRARVLARTHGHQPALLGAIDAVEQTATQPLAAALEFEARFFGEVTAGEVCKNLVHVFFLREAAKKRSLDGWFDRVPAFSPAPAGAVGTPALPRRVGVVGAGVMGAGIAQWLALRGFDVVLRDVRTELVARGLEVARELCDEAVRRGKITAGEANSALHRIRPTTAWDGFGDCELVIEAIVENVAGKQQLFTELGAIVRPDALLASNTSALPIEEIAGHVLHPQRTVGLHFFNPVGRMPLVELILARDTSADSAARALAFLRALGKSPVICRSSPGFLVTRVLFFYLNAAVRLWESGVPTETLDAALRDFGWPMGPLRLIDEVGVDVTDFIFGEMAHYFPERFARSSACGALLAAGLRGRKNGAGRGFYCYEGKREAVNDAETRALLVRGPAPTGAPAMSELSSPAASPPADLAAALMRVMTAEAERCLAEGVVRSADEVDFALLAGAGFPAFRGGLLRWARGGGLG